MTRRQLSSGRARRTRTAVPRSWGPAAGCFGSLVVGEGWGVHMVTGETEEPDGFIPQAYCCRVRNLNDRIRQASLLGGKKTPLGQRMHWGWGGRRGTFPPSFLLGPSRHLQTLRSEQPPPFTLHSDQRGNRWDSMFALNTHRHGHRHRHGHTHTINKTKLANNLKPDLFQIN